MKLETSTIDELCNIEFGTRVVRKKDGGTIYPVYGGGNETFFMDTTNRQNRVVIARFAMSEKCVRFIEGKFFLNDSGLTLSPKTKKISQEYLDGIILSLNNTIYKLGRGTAQKNLDMKKFRLIKITYPTLLSEQQNMVLKFNGIYQNIYELIKSINIKNKKIKDLKYSIIKKKLTNELKDTNTWKSKPLSEIAYTAGRIGWKGLTAKEYKDKGPLFLSVHSLNYGDYVDFSKAFHITQERYDESPEIKLKSNDLLICKDGAGIGKVGIVREVNEPTTINGSLLLIRPLEEIIPKFLYYYLLSPIFQNIIAKKIEGATTPHLYQRDIKPLMISYPSISVQKLIVSEINLLSKYCNETSETYHKLTNEYDLLKSSLINKLQKKVA